MLQSSFLKKKDAINIVPFLDIILVLFVIIIVVASFNNDAIDLKKTNENLLLKINILEKQLNFLKKENQMLKDKNKALLLLNNKNSIFLKQTKEILHKCVVDISVMDGYLEIGDRKYSFNEFLGLAKNGLVKNANFYIKKTKSAENFYKKLKEELKKLGFSFKD